ncbi:transcription termination factor, mitochondrial isoform X2 [Manduca sexta]|uniref:transcription termination factor, mitochondrial isoform X2 n=1 Tax=Manduca sexta TaxID=7130 RepID=UPI00188F78F4|nr:transcription termination factor, mitochondrial isoform X2 [Manduca sexta]
MIWKSLMPSLSLLLSKNVTIRTLVLAADGNTSKRKYRAIDSAKSLTAVSYGYKASSKQNGTDESKAKIILQLNFKSDEDALPFQNLPITTLKHVLHVTAIDKKNGYCENRLYYIASRIKCPPNVLSEQLAKRIFVYSLTFDWLKRSLDVLLEMNVSGERILRDLWVLKYHHETIQKRLTKVRSMGVDVLYPWMVRCSENILNRSIQLSQETKDILGETKNTQIYLANRLNTTLEAVEEMSIKMPALKTMRVIKLRIHDIEKQT